MKAIRYPHVWPSLRPWATILFLSSAFPLVCRATPAAPAAINLTITNALLSSPGATPSSPSLTLYWSNSTGATGSMTYQVYRSTMSGGPYTEIASSIAATSATPTYTDTTTAAGTTYYYVVAATDTTGQSGYSPEISGITTTAPGSPSVTNGNQQVTVTWTGTSGNDYNIYASSSTSSAWVVLASNLKGSSGTMTYVDSAGPAGTGLLNGDTYYYAVAAVAGPNNLSETDSSSLTAAPNGTYPSSPTPIVTAVTPNGSTKSVSLQWTATPGATGYNIARSTTNTGPFTCPSNCLLSSPQTALSYIDTSAPSGTLVYYQILATNGSGYGTSYSTIGVSTSITTATFNTTKTGATSKAGSWTYDVKGNPSDADITSDLNNAGTPFPFTAVRVAWYPQYPLMLSGSVLDPIAQSDMDNEVALAKQVKSTLLPFFLSPKTGNLDKGYYDGSTPTPSAISIPKWVDAMQYSRDYYQNSYSANIEYNGIENEPDNTSCQFTSSTFGTILNSLDSNWGTTIQEGPDTYRSGDGALWLGYTGTVQAPQPMYDGSLCETSYTPIQDSTPITITKASTHAIGGTPLADFEAFLTQARDTDNLSFWLTEIHQLAEPLVALNFGTNQGIARALWWSHITPVRGHFMQYSKAYNLLFAKFAADKQFAISAGYFNSSANNSLSIFIANNSLDPSYTIPIYETFTFECTNQAVYFNGSSTATTSYTVTEPSYDNYNGEFEILVNW